VKGDWAAINILTNRYVVNVKNSFHFPFLDRQKAFLFKWLEHRELDKLYRYDITCEINGWPRTTPRVFPSEVHELIKRHRQLISCLCINMTGCSACTNALMRIGVAPSDVIWVVISLEVGQSRGRDKLLTMSSFSLSSIQHHPLL
jgi:hypothetical protein